MGSGGRKGYGRTVVVRDGSRRKVVEQPEGVVENRDRHLGWGEVVGGEGIEEDLGWWRMGIGT